MCILITSASMKNHYWALVCKALVHCHCMDTAGEGHTSCECRALESAYHDSERQSEEAVKDLKAKRTAYEVLHTDWLATQEELKVHRHVLSRLDMM